MDFAELKQRLTLYEKLMRLDKPIGTLLLLWPTFWALWLATEGQPHILLVWIFALGTLLMRSAGCVINDYADRKFDPHVKRTQDRPLAAGTVSVREALVLFAVLCLCAFAVALPIMGDVWHLTLVALFLAASYPFTKRFFALPQAYLGVAFGFGIPMAFAAATGEVGPLAWTLLAANISWALAYDTEYAMVDRDDDLRIGMKTSAITLGRLDVPAIAGFYAAYLLIWAWVLEAPTRSIWLWLALAAAAAQALWHLWLIRRRERMACFLAFRMNHWLGLTVFAGVALSV
jgi:4-hydroxybenzoate polyprenyltransferase